MALANASAVPPLRQHSVLGEICWFTELAQHSLEGESRPLIASLSAEVAQAECEASEWCSGLTQSANGTYTGRSGKIPVASHSGETAFVRQCSEDGAALAQMHSRAVSSSGLAVELDAAAVLGVLPPGGRQTILYIDTCNICGINWCASSVLIGNSPNIENEYVVGPRMQSRGCAGVGPHWAAVRNSRTGRTYAVVPAWGYSRAGAVDGVAAWDLTMGTRARSSWGTVRAQSHLTILPGRGRQARGLAIGQQYTMAFWLQWRVDNGGWRTLWRGDRDHCALVRSGGTELGVYSNRNGAFRGSGYQIVPYGWQLVVVTGYGNSASSPMGTSTFYVGTADEAPRKVGTADRVCSGTKMWLLGWPSQGPGRVAQAWVWERALNPGELGELWRSTRARYDPPKCRMPVEYFDGRDDYLTAPVATTGTLSGAFGFAAWVRRYRCGDAWDRVFDFAGKGGGMSFGNRDVMFLAFRSGMTYGVFRGTQWQGVRTGGAFPCGHWTHVAVSHDASGQARIYWDGVLKASASVWTPAAVYRPSRYIGRSNWWWDPMFYGEMRDVFFFDEAPSAGDVADLAADRSYPADSLLYATARTWCAPEPPPPSPPPPAPPPPSPPPPRPPPCPPPPPFPPPPPWTNPMLEKPGAVAYLRALSRHAKQLHAALEPIYDSTLQQYGNIGADPGSVPPEADGLSERGGGLLNSMTNQMSQPPPSPFVRPPPSPPLGSVNVMYPPSPTPASFAEPKAVVEGPSLSGRPGDWWPTERPTSFDVPPAWESYYSGMGVANQAGDQPASGPFANFGEFLQTREAEAAAAAPPHDSKPRSAFERRRGWLYEAEPLRTDGHPSCEPCRRRAAGCAAGGEGGAAPPDGCAGGVAVGCGSAAATRAECRWESAAAARRACDAWPACGGFVCIAGGAAKGAGGGDAGGGGAGAECAARSVGGAWRLSLSTTPPTSYRKHPRPGPPLTAKAATLRAATPPAEAATQPDATSASLDDDAGSALSAEEGTAALQPLLEALFGGGGGGGGFSASRRGMADVAGGRPLNASFEMRQARRAIRRAAAQFEQRQRRAAFKRRAAAAATAGSAGSAAALLAPGADYYLGNKRVIVPSQSGEDMCYGMACQQAGVASGHNDPNNPGSSEFDGLVPIANKNYNWEGPMLEMKDVSRVLDGNAWLAKQIESMYAGG